MSVVLRPMGRADVDAVAAMEEILFGAEAWSPELLATEVTADPVSRYYIVADDEGVIAGYGGLLAQRGGQADVLTLAVAADRWGEGIGGALLDGLLSEAARRGCTEVFLEVRVDNDRAQRLYRRRGFAGIGIRRGVLPALGHRRPGDAPDRASRRRTRRKRHLARPPPGQAGEMTEPLVLGIETSCDETGAGLVRGHELLADSVASSVAEHARFGGVVPEVASRAHLEAMVATVDRALATAGVKLAEVDGIAVTAGPGLAGALLVGVSAAKAYALALGKPLYAVNHLAAHIAVDQLEHGPLPRPAVALLVSGGHSSLLLVPDVAGEVLPLGATIDDAAGEAYDKVARLLGMPFPGGPPVDAAARDGDGARHRVPARQVPRRHLRLLLLRPEDRGRALGRRPGRRPASRCRWPTWQPPSRRPSPMS